jgi:hypothetical protein
MFSQPCRTLAGLALLPQRPISKHGGESIDMKNTHQPAV